VFHANIESGKFEFGCRQDVDQCRRVPRRRHGPDPVLITAETSEADESCDSGLVGGGSLALDMCSPMTRGGDTARTVDFTRTRWRRATSLCSKQALAVPDTSYRLRVLSF